MAGLGVPVPLANEAKGLLIDVLDPAAKLNPEFDGANWKPELVFVLFPNEGNEALGDAGWVSLDFGCGVPPKDCDPNWNGVFCCCVPFAALGSTFPKGVCVA